jgi:carbohydrate diacid regulator
MLTKEIAETIVNETMNRLGRNINIMDQDGVIIASGDRLRLGERHLGAWEAIRQGVAIKIDDANQQDWHGAQCGINLPIYCHQRIVGAIGITGDPEQISQFADFVQMTTGFLLEYAYMRTAKDWSYRLRTKLFEELMKPDPDANQINSLLQAMKHDTLKPIQVIAFAFSHEDAINIEDLRFLVDNSWGTCASLSGIINKQQVVSIVFGNEQEDQITQITKISQKMAQSGIVCRISYSESSVTSQHLPIMLQEALFALSFTSEGQPIRSYRQLAPRFLLEQLPAKIIARYMHQHALALSDELEHTLQTFFDHNRNIQQTASALYVHKNTVIYRLNKIAQQTGKDPHEFHDALSLQLAIWLKNRDATLLTSSTSTLLQERVNLSWWNNI